MVLNSPFPKTLYIDFPSLPLWSSLSELYEMLPPGLQSSFCPKQNFTCKPHIVHFFKLDISHPQRSNFVKNLYLYSPAIFNA